MKYFLVFVLLKVPLIILSQVLRTDTVINTDSYKEISVTLKGGGLYKIISDKDTVVYEDPSVYDNYVWDSLKNSIEYQNRDTISCNPEYLLIQIINKTRTSWTGCDTNISIYYNPKLKSIYKGVFVSIDKFKSDCKIGYINEKNFALIVELLNENMAFNPKSVQEKAGEDLTFGVISSREKVFIKCIENKIDWEEAYDCGSYLFGFREDIASGIGKLCGEFLENVDPLNYKRFVEMNEEVILADNDFKSILEAFDVVNNNK